MGSKVDGKYGRLAKTTKRIRRDDHRFSTPSYARRTSSTCQVSPHHIVDMLTDSALPFMIPGAIKVKKASTISAHPKLDSFPSLLPTIVPSQPHVLNVSSPDRSTSKRLLTGTLPLGKGAVFDELLLKLARSCDRLSGFLDIVLRGLEVVDHAFKEGDKQTMIWREELEECGEQRGRQLHPPMSWIELIGSDKRRGAFLSVSVVGHGARVTGSDRMAREQAHWKGTPGQGDATMH